MKKILLILILLFGLVLTVSCDKDEEQDGPVVDEGGEVTGLSAENFVLEDEEKTISFEYVFDQNVELIKKDFNKIQKIGCKISINGEEKKQEITFEKVTNVYKYKLILNNEFSNNYKDTINVKLYYIFLNEKDEAKERFSNVIYSFNVYELAKKTAGDFSEEILSICEPDKIVRLDVSYNDEEFAISTTTMGCTAEILELEGKNVKIKISSSEKKFSENLRMYFNGKPSTDFVNKGTYIEYQTITETVTAVEINLDIKEYKILSEENELYQLSVLDEKGVGVIKVIIELKNDNILSPLAKVILNGEEVEVKEYQNGSYVVEVIDPTITYVEVTFDIDTFKVTSSSDKFTTLVKRDDNHENIDVIIDSNNEDVFSKRVKVVINKKEYELSEITLEDKKIILSVVDERVKKVDLQLQFEGLKSDEYTITTSDNSYTASIIADPNHEFVIVKVIPNNNNTFSADVIVTLNGSMLTHEDYTWSSSEINYQTLDTNYILPTIEFTLKVLGYAPKDYAVNVDSDKYSAALTTDKNNEFIYITITLNEGYKFSDDVKVMVDGREVHPITYEIDGNKLIYTMDDPNWTDIF